MCNVAVFSDCESDDTDDSADSEQQIQIKSLDERKYFVELVFEEEIFNFEVDFNKYRNPYTRQSFIITEVSKFIQQNGLIPPKPLKKYVLDNLEVSLIFI